MNAARNAAVLEGLRNVPSVASLIAELEYIYDHHNDPPPPKRTPEEIQAALDRAYRPFWKRWFFR